MNAKTWIIKNYGSWENFFDCGEDDLEKENKMGNIDEGMFPVCKFFQGVRL